MKKNLLISLIAICTFGLAHAQEVAKTESPKNGAKIVFTTLEHNYGTIRKGGDGSCSFEFINDGNEPLILSSVRTTCGCTTSQWNKAPILPGQKGTIKVRYDTNRLGNFLKMITVNSNAIENPSIVLKIKGKVEKP